MGLKQIIFRLSKKPFNARVVEINGVTFIHAVYWEHLGSLFMLDLRFLPRFINYLVRYLYVCKYLTNKRKRFWLIVLIFINKKCQLK